MKKKRHTHLKTKPGHQGSSELPQLVIYTSYASPHTVPGELRAVHVTPERRQLEATKTDFLVSPPYEAFSFTDFSLYPSAIINHNWE